MNALYVYKHGKENPGLAINFIILKVTIELAFSIDNHAILYLQ